MVVRTHSDDVVGRRDLQGHSAIEFLAPEEPHPYTTTAPLWPPDHDPQVRCVQRQLRYRPILRSLPGCLHHLSDDN